MRALKAEKSLEQEMNGDTEGTGVGSQGKGSSEDTVARNCDAVLLTAKQVAEMLKTGESNFYKLNREGVIPRPITIGWTKRWRKRDIVDWINAGCPKDWNDGTEKG